MQTTFFMRAVQAVALTIGLLALSSCGGGGGSGGDSGVAGLAVSSTLASQCEAPRPNTADTPGSIDKEKAWVRSFMDETYLWYKDVPQVDPAGFTKAKYSDSTFKALSAYFQALKTPLRTKSGKLVDEFSFTVPTANLVRQQSGVSSGYGIRFSQIINVIPRQLFVLYVEPGSPAQLAGVQRGDAVTSVDGVSMNTTTDAGIAVLNAGLFPQVASKTTSLGLRAANTATERFVTMTSSENITVSPVQLTKTFTVGTSTVGYLVLNSFGIKSAERQMLDAMTQFKSAGVKELVLDLRYNGGGFIGLSNQLAWMVGDTGLAGKTFEKATCNDKNPFGLCNQVDLFAQATQNFSVPAGQALPQLGLKRVFVLTSDNTCSASESIINGLAPFMNVVRIGSTTCGKPYGFYYVGNCGTSYAAMQFKGENAQGFGDYADGFAPTCPAQDDLSKERGDQTELMLATALGYMQTGSCQVASAMAFEGKQSVSSPLLGHFRVQRSPMEEVRLLGSPAN
jgi:carboxyl-terminal processing protease